LRERNFCKRYGNQKEVRIAKREEGGKRLCVCVCVRERERERDSERETDRERKSRRPRKREIVKIVFLNILDGSHFLFHCLHQATSDVIKLFFFLIGASNHS
jgi:hypothetical protein